MWEETGEGAELRTGVSQADAALLERGHKRVLVLQARTRELEHDLESLESAREATEQQLRAAQGQIRVAADQLDLFQAVAACKLNESTGGCTISADDENRPGGVRWGDLQSGTPITVS